MDEKQTSSSWDDLLRQVGAEPPADALERKRPAIETRFEPPVAPPPIEKPKPGDWSSLASQLGVEAVEPPAPSAPKPTRRAEPPAKSRSAPTAGDLESSFAGIAPIESEFEEIVEAEIDDIDFTDDDSDLEEDAAAIGFGDDEDDDPDSLSGEAARNAFEALFQAGSFGALPSRESPPPSRGRSAESRSSSESRSPRESREPRETRAPRARRESRDRDSSKGRRGRPVGEPQARRPAGDDDLETDEPLRDADEPAADAAVESEGGIREEGDRPRRRRRRRGGRGRDRDRDRDAPGSAELKKAATSRASDDEEEWAEPLDADEASHDDEADADAPVGEGDDERPVRRRRGRRRGRRGSRSEEEQAAASPASAARNGRSAPSRVAKEAADDEDDDDSHDSIASHAGDIGEEGDDDDDSAAIRSSHKNIPTWSDAISVMIETNMQARKSSPQRPSGRERGGRGRGRGGGRGGNVGGRGRGGS